MSSKTEPTLIEKLRLARGWSLERLGAEIGASISTARRIQDGDVNLISPHVPKLAAAFGIDELEFIALLIGRTAERSAVPSLPAGFAESSIRPYTLADGPDLEGARFGPTQDKWTISTRDLDAIGLYPGDVVVVDISQQATDEAGTGDAVVVQVIDPNDPFIGETHLRELIEPNLFVTNSHSVPLSWFDKRRDDVRLKGVIVRKLVAV